MAEGDVVGDVGLVPEGVEGVAVLLEGLGVEAFFVGDGGVGDYRLGVVRETRVEERLG